MNLFLDSSVYVAGLQRHEPHYGISLAFIEKGYFDASTQIVTSWLVVLEVLDVLRRNGFSDTLLKDVFVQLFGDDSCLKLDLTGRSIDTFFSLSSFPILLKTSDFSLLLSAKENADVLVSWDEQLLKQGSFIMPCRKPSEIQLEF